MSLQYPTTQSRHCVKQQTHLFWLDSTLTACSAAFRRSKLHLVVAAMGQGAELRQVILHPCVRFLLQMERPEQPNSEWFKAVMLQPARATVLRAERLHRTAARLPRVDRQHVVDSVATA